MNVKRLGLQEVVDNWESVSAYLDRALKWTQGEQQAADILLKVPYDLIQLWAAYADDGSQVGVASTEVVQHPRLRKLRVVTLAGDRFKEWGPLLDTELCAFAKEQGATRIEALGRKGLVKLLQPYGFRPAYLALGKEVK